MYAQDADPTHHSEKQVMKAAVRYHYCEPDQLRILELPIPKPGPNEVLIRVRTCTVNRTDLGVLRGIPYAMRAFAGFPKPRYAVTGTDFAGVIEDVGEGVHEFKIGDRVWGFWDHGQGTHAEYACIPTKYPILPIPQGASFEEMVSCGEAAHYAYNFLNKVNLEPGNNVLVIGGTGGIGSAAIQLLKATGIQVTAVCHEAHVDKVKSLGPDRVIALGNVDLTKENIQYDFVFDAVGKSRFSFCKPILKPKGVYLSSELGPNWENLTLALTTPIWGGKKVIFPIPGSILESMKAIQSLFIEGKFRPLIDRSFRLDQIREAFQYVASGQKIGNVILEIGEE